MAAWSYTMPRPLVKSVDSILPDSDYVFAKPQKLHDGSRFSMCKGPLIQTGEMVVSFAADGATATVLCDEAYADLVALIEDRAVDMLSAHSEQWFNRELSHDDVEHMMKPAIKGHRTPKMIVKSATVKCYDHALKPADRPTTATAAVLLVQVEGIRLDEKRCELVCSLRQMRLPEPMAEELAEDDEFQEPAFV